MKHATALLSLWAAPAFSHPGHSTPAGYEGISHWAAMSDHAPLLVIMAGLVVWGLHRRRRG